MNGSAATGRLLSAMGMRAESDPIATVFDQVAVAKADFEQHTGRSFLSLAAGAPDARLLPSALFSQLEADVLADAGPSALNYSMPRGLPAFRDTLASSLARIPVTCTADQLLITSGGLEALGLAAMITVNPGDVVLVERPAFPGALSLLRLVGATVMPVDIDGDGISVDSLAAAIDSHHPRAVWLMPDYQNPTGAAMPPDRRQGIADLLQRHDLLAFEDGTYADLGFDGDPPPPIQSLAPAHVVYVTSLSKTFAPAVRLGAMAAPARIAERAADLKSALNMQASTLHQAVAARFLADGHRDRHLAHLRETYRRRRDAMLTALERHFPPASGLTWAEPTGGMFLWLCAPPERDLGALLSTAHALGVSYVPGELFSIPPGSGRHFARLNFASSTEDELDEAIRRLAAALAA